MSDTTKQVLDLAAGCGSHGRHPAPEDQRGDVAAETGLSPCR